MLWVELGALNAYICYIFQKQLIRQTTVHRSNGTIQVMDATRFPTFGTLVVSTTCRALWSKSQWNDEMTMTKLSKLDLEKSKHPFFSRSLVKLSDFSSVVSPENHLKITWKSIPVEKLSDFSGDLSGIFFPVLYRPWLANWVAFFRPWPGARRRLHVYDQHHVGKLVFFFLRLVVWNIFFPYGSVSKPCTPGEHQNSW